MLFTSPFFKRTFNLMPRPHHRGFSLVELSIVLVILGLLVGGVLSAQSLIRAAAIRSIASDYSRFATATYTFRDKYFAIPGDIPNATRFWGAQHATPATCITTPSTTALTCDGNGDGTLISAGNVYIGSEIHRYWQHLANAGLIEGTYSGVGANNPTTQDGSTPGVNSPKLKVGQSAFQARYSAPITWVDPVTGAPASADLYNGSYGNGFFYGVTQGGVYNPHDPIISTEEAWNIDTKVDDGRPSMGIIRTFKSGSTASWVSLANQCADSPNQNTAQYNFSSSGIKCALIMSWQ